MTNLTLADSNSTNLLLVLNKFGQPFGLYKFHFKSNTNKYTEGVLVHQGDGIIYFGYGNTKYEFKVVDEIVKDGKSYASIAPSNFTYDEFKAISGLSIVAFTKIKS